MAGPKITRPPKPKAPANGAAPATTSGKSNITKLKTGLASGVHSDTQAVVSKILGSEHINDEPTAPSGLVDVAHEAAIDEIAHRPDNPRPADEYSLTDPDMLALLPSVEAHGILQDLTVCTVEAWTSHRPDAEFDDGVKYVALMGNRRLAAAKHAGLAKAPVRIVNKLAEPLQTREVGLIENIHRRSLNPLQEAAEMQAIMNETGESARAFAKRLGFSHTAINDKLALLRLIEPFQELVLRFGAAKLGGLKTAVAIANLSDADQRKLFDLGSPFAPSRLNEIETPAPAPGELATSKAVSIPKRSTPSDVVKVLRDKLTPEILVEVRKLLDSSN